MTRQNVVHKPMLIHVLVPTAMTTIAEANILVHKTFPILKAMTLPQAAFDKHLDNFENLLGKN